MKKKVAALALASVLGASSLSAQFMTLPTDYSLSMNMEFSSQHVFRGLKQADESFQPGIELGWGEAYLGAWAHMPQDSDQVVSQEHEYYIGSTLSIPRIDFANFDAGMVVREFLHQDRNRTHEFYAGVLFDEFDALEGLQFSAYFRHDADVKHIIFEPGASYRHAFDGPNALIPVILQASGKFGFLADRKPVDNFRNDQESFKDSYNYYAISGEAMLRIDPNATLGAGVHYQDAWNQDDAQPRDANLYWSVFLTMAF